MMRRILIGSLVGGALLLAACGGSADDGTDDVANATGDSMASLDEMGSGGQFARLMIPTLKAPASMRPSLGHEIGEWVLPSAHAAGCVGDTFTACSSGVRTRTFNGCSVGTATLNGSVELDFSDTTCAMSASADSVTRKANFTLTGPNGGSITVDSTGGGQKVTRTDTGFDYEVLGMHREGTSASGKAHFSIDTSTTAPIGVTGTSRQNRVVSGGTLVVVHNVLGYTATISPTNVTWDGTCNCPTSGSWAGTLSGSRTGSITLQITGCGTGTATTADGTSRAVTFDRCTAI